MDEHAGEVADLVKTYDQAAAFFPDFLGFNGPRTYLVLAQNNAELLPTGGLISVYGVVTLRDGSVEDMSFADAIAFGENWQNATHEYVEPPAPLKNYLLKDWSWSLDLANWSPDFPTAARQAQLFFEKGGGRPVDGVIGITVTTLEQLLGVTGPVSVDEYGVTVDPANVMDVTETLTRTPLEPGSDRKAFAAFLAEEMLHRLLYLPSSQWSPLLDAAEELRDSKTALFYSFDPALQSLAHEMKLDGALEDPPGDYLMPVEASVNSTKLNIVIDKRMEMQVALDELGDAHSTVTLRYVNNVASWEQGRDPELVYRLMLGGLYGGYLRLFTKHPSRLLDIAIDGASAGAEEVGVESGKAVFGRFFSLPRGARREVAFHYVTPGVAELGDSTARYRLFIQKQPGTDAVPLSLHFSLPEGAKPVSLEMDGERLDGNGLEVQDGPLARPGNRAGLSDDRAETELRRPTRKSDGEIARPTIFLDRDGVVNRNRDDYVKCWEEFEFLPGSLDALRTLTRRGVRVVVVTNQSAVGRGIISRETLDGIHRRMVAEVEAYGGRIDAVLCCPHAPDDGCRCRKPRPGLLLEATRRFRIDPATSCFVGDSLSDLKAAHAAGIPFVMVLSGKGLPAALRRARYRHPLRWIAPDLETAARWFVRRDGWHEEQEAA